MQEPKRLARLLLTSLSCECLPASEGEGDVLYQHLPGSNQTGERYELVVFNLANLVIGRLNWDPTRSHTPATASPLICET